MTITLEVRRKEGDPLNITLSQGKILFVLGANGTGKSSLMQRLFSENQARARWISAHRQTWFASGSPSLSPASKQQTETSLRSRDTHPDARWMDLFADSRADITLHNLVDAENRRARNIASAMDLGEFEKAKELSIEPSPIGITEKLLSFSNLQIGLEVRENQEIWARKPAGTSYSIAELSDGERNALLIAANVLTADAGTILLIDEPERHLHRAIISPLLTMLFAERSDCYFVISTHEVELPLDNPGCLALLLSGCSFKDRLVTGWDAELVTEGAVLDADLRRSILGGRRKILFVEGTSTSLDVPIYSVVFPNVSVIAKSSCKEVQSAVKSLRAATELHWLQAYGIVDNDGRSSGEIEGLKEDGIYALEVHSVESVYYHPEIQAAVTERHSKVTGEDAQQAVLKANTAALNALALHADRLSRRAAERILRQQLFEYVPGKKELEAGAPINVALDTPGVVASERKKFDLAIEQGDLIGLITRYPVRETPALGAIVNELGFKDRAQYERAVRQMLLEDDDALKLVRSMLGTLATDIEAE